MCEGVGGRKVSVPLTQNGKCSYVTSSRLLSKVTGDMGHVPHQAEVIGTPWKPTEPQDGKIKVLVLCKRTVLNKT